MAVKISKKWLGLFFAFIMFVNLHEKHSLNWSLLSLLIVDDDCFNSLWINDNTAIASNHYFYTQHFNLAMLLLSSWQLFASIKDKRTEVIGNYCHLWTTVWRQQCRLSKTSKKYHKDQKRVKWKFTIIDSSSVGYQKVPKSK